MASVRRAYADGPFGQIHYAAAGAGDPILLLHQTPRSWDEYAGVIDRLAASRTAIAMDLPGMGASDPPPGEPRIEDFGDAATALLDSLAIQRADVFGHHTGSFVAIDLAARRPDRVRSLMLSAPSWVDEAYIAANPLGGDLEVDNAPPAASGEHLLALWRQRQPDYPEHGQTELLSRFLRDALRVADPRAGHVACGRYRVDLAVDELSCPVLLLGCEADKYTIGDLERFIRRLPGATVETIPDGRVPLEHQSEQVADAIERFLATVTPPVPR